MSVKVRLASGEEAIVDGYEWVAADPSLRRMLNSFRQPYGPSASDPDPDYSLAEAAVKLFGGEIISADPPLDPPQYGSTSAEGAGVGSGALSPENGQIKSTSPDSDVPDFTDPNVQKSTASESYAQASAPLKELLAADVVD